MWEHREMAEVVVILHEPLGSRKAGGTLTGRSVFIQHWLRYFIPDPVVGPVVRAG